jgi:alpha-L-rhamnosidase
MFGGGLVWLYRQLAGMQAYPAQPGYKHIIFRPQPVDDLTDVTYSNRTPYGQAGISWQQDGNSFEMQVTVPVGSEATVCVPAASVQNVLESGTSVQSATAVDFIKMQDGYAVFLLGSGAYHFVVKQ